MIVTSTRLTLSSRRDIAVLQKESSSLEDEEDVNVWSRQHNRSRRHPPLREESAGRSHLPRRSRATHPNRRPEQRRRREYRAETQRADRDSRFESRCRWHKPDALPAPEDAKRRPAGALGAQAICRYPTGTYADEYRDAGGSRPRR